PDRPPVGTDRDGVDAAGALADAVLGLAADAVGQGRVGEARRLLAVADRFGDNGWRARVRLGWVTAEVALASGRPQDAVPVAETAVRGARSARARRHVTKSEALLATTLVNMTTERDRERAIRLLEGIVPRSLERGMLPLVWPSALLLADVTPGAADRWRDLGQSALSCVLSRTDGDGVALAAASPWTPASS
ncbi:MAG: hypothetical protein ACRDQ5_21120, partial [Sciscionella sp.]